MKTNQVRRVFLLTVFVLLGVQLFAQDSFEIKGKIVKSDRKGGNYATVTLLDSKTMEIVAEDVCNENGEFVIEPVTKGDYILLVQKPGFPKPEKRFIRINEKGTVVETADIALSDTNRKTDKMKAN